MKEPRRTKAWAFVAVAAALCGVLLGFVVLSGGAVQPVQRGESLPQSTGAPGISLPGVRLWGTPNRDLFTPVNSPPYASAESAQAFLRDDDRVYILRKPQWAYVFPEVLIASYHVINDVIEGEPLAITYCMLAGTAATFSRRIADRVLTLGLTGQLYCGNSVLYDQETNTDWLQLNGEPVRGHYFGRARLDAASLELATWRQARVEKGIRVLAPLRDMKEYREWHADLELATMGQKVVESQLKLDPRMIPYARGLGIAVQGEARFYPEDPHGKARLRNEQVGGWAIAVLQGGKDEPSRIFRRRHQGKLLDFALDLEASPDPGHDGVVFRDRQTGSKWSHNGVCLEGQYAGSRLDNPHYSHVYWFVWSSLHPETGLP